MMTFVYPYYDSQGRTEIVPAEEWFDYNQSGGLSEFDPFNYESRYSAGWDGDRLHVYENDAGEFGYVWRLAWDSPQQAQQFVAGYQRVLRYWGGERVGPNVWRIPQGGFEDAFYIDVSGAVFEKGKVQSLPSTYLIGRRGRVRERVVGHSPWRISMLLEKVRASDD